MIDEDPAEWQQTPEDNALDNFIVIGILLAAIVLYVWLSA